MVRVGSAPGPHAPCFLQCADWLALTDFESPVKESRSRGAGDGADDRHDAFAAQRGSRWRERHADETPTARSTTCPSWRIREILSLGRLPSTSRAGFATVRFK